MTWEYIAGFFDGEGTIANANRNTRFRIAIPQTDLIVLTEIANFTKMGRICKVKKRKSHWKESWVYYIGKMSDVEQFLVKVSPFLIVKKQIALKFLPEIKKLVESQEARKHRLTQRKITALKLRKKGLSYWRIGLAMNLDRSYVRRLIVNRW